MLRRYSQRLIVAGCLMATPVLAEDSLKSTPAPKKHASRISSTVDVQPSASLTDEESYQISFAAGRILKHVAQAREAIHEKKKDDVVNHVDQCLKLIAIIDGVLPQYKVKTEIKSAEQAYSDEDNVKPRYVTLFDELERRDIISPIKQAKQEAQEKHTKDQGIDRSEDKGPAPVAVSHVDVNHTSAKLDLLLARNFLNRAKQSLRDAQFDVADAALLAIQSRGVLFEYEEIDLPLEEAADNLKLAETEMKEGRTAEAKAALHIAVDQLKRYEKLVGHNRGSEVNALHQEITKLTNELEKGTPSESERKKMAGQISEWWSGATKWFRTKTK